MSDFCGEDLYKKEAQILGMIAFALYFFSLPYIFIVAMHLNAASMDWINEAPWRELAFGFFIVNLPLIVQSVCIILLIIMGIKKRYKGVLLLSVLPALTLVLCTSIESIFRLLS